MQAILTKQATTTTPATCRACNGPAILHLQGSSFAGMVQCQNLLRSIECGEIEEHHHENTHREEIELNQRPGSNMLDIVEVDVCDRCGVIVEGEN